MIITVDEVNNKKELLYKTKGDYENEIEKVYCNNGSNSKWLQEWQQDVADQKSDAGSDSTGSDTKTESLSGTITAAGSSALKPLADDAADSFLNENPDVSITIDAGGSGEGLKQVSEGTVDIGNSDVAAEDKLDADKAKNL